MTNAVPPHMGVIRKVINDGGRIRVFWTTDKGEFVGEIEATIMGPQAGVLMAQDFLDLMNENFGSKIVVAHPGQLPKAP